MPATKYELSIYLSTPILFWIFIISSIFVCLVHLTSQSKYPLLVLTILYPAGAVFFLPIIRGYYYYGAGDSLTHLGITRDLLTGTISGIDFLYPGFHFIASFIQSVTAIPLQITLMTLFPLLVIMYSLFTGIIVRQIVPKPQSLAIGVVSGLFLLPVNNISTHLMFHPSSMTIFFFPIVIFAGIKLRLFNKNIFDLKNGKVWRLLIFILLTSMTIFHPQQAGNAVVFILLVLFVSHFTSKIRDHTFPFSYFFSLIALILVVFVGWISTHSRPVLSGTVLVIRFIETVSDVFLGSSTSEISQSSNLLSLFGGSIEILFIRVFSVNMIFIFLSVILILAVTHGWYGFSSYKLFTERMVVGTIPVVIMTIGLVGSDVGQSLRYFSFGMVAVTIFGGIVVSHLCTHLSIDLNMHKIGVVFTIIFLLVLPIMFHSPFVYLPTSHITESEHDSYKYLINMSPDEQEILGVRATSKRHSSAILGYEYFSNLNKENTLPIAHADELQNTSDKNNYIIIGASDIEREVILYNSVEYTQSMFDSYSDSPSSNKIYSNGHSNSYIV
jgi:hypothetical protein